MDCHHAHARLSERPVPPELDFVGAALALRSRLEHDELTWPEYQAAFMALVREHRERTPN